jgi:hypothetical protein
MLAKLLPSTADFEYTGSRTSLWLLGVVLFLKVAIALGSIFNGHYAASVADGIPIDSYTPQGAQAFVSLFASLGLSQVVIAVLGAVLLARYRALVPLFLLLLLVEYVARKGISIYLPIARSGGSPGGAINWALFGVMLAAFVLSLRQRNAASALSTGD